MDWVIFSLLSRASWGADNIIDKLLRGKYLPDSLVLTLTTSVTFLLISLFIIVFNGLSWIGLAPAALAILAGSFQLLAVFAFYQAVAREEISRVIPLFQFTPPLVLVISFFFLGEVLTLSNYVAFVLILVGGFLISVQRTAGLFKLRTAFWWMLLSSLIYAVQAVLFKSLYVSYPFWDLTVYLGFGEFIPALAVFLFVVNIRTRVTKQISKLKPTGWQILVLGMFFIAIASLSGLMAFTTGPVSLISALRGFQSVFVLLFAVFLSIWFPKILKEELGKGVLGIKVVAIFLMVIGLYLIYI